MTGRLLRIAVVGHTNTGKTSLMRTLKRDPTFGEVTDEPGTTREVARTTLHAEGRPVAELYDTPGLEDSIALLDHVQGLPGPATDPVERLETFLASPEAHGRFLQEAKVLRQVLQSDLALYVADAREEVRARHRDELALLDMTGKPVLPVLNFTARPEARAGAWEESLRRTGKHVLVGFDAVVRLDSDEQALFEKAKLLLPADLAPALDALAGDRARLHQRLLGAASRVVADLLVDAAACVVHAPAEPPQRAAAAQEDLRDRVRRRERDAVGHILELFGFGSKDHELEELGIVEGEWGLDLFSTEALKALSLRLGKGAAVGGGIGLLLDLALAGLSLGTGTALGALVGGLLRGRPDLQRVWRDRVRGIREYHCNDATLALLAARQVLLAREMLRRGHASQQPVRTGARKPAPSGPDSSRLLSLLHRARAHPPWSRLNPEGQAPALDPGPRELAVRDIAACVEQALAAPLPSPGGPDRPIC